MNYGCITLIYQAGLVALSIQVGRLFGLRPSANTTITDNYLVDPKTYWLPRFRRIEKQSLEQLNFIEVLQVPIFTFYSLNDKVIAKRYFN